MRYIMGFLLACGVIYAQAGNAELYGTVRDPSGLAIAGATVTAEESSTTARFSVVSSATGDYRLLGLPAGDFVLTITHPGFKTYHRSGLKLHLGDHTGLDVQLELGQTTESVEVNAAAPLLETATGTVDFHVDTEKVQTLPLDGRNFVPLIALSPGVALPGGGSLLPRINGSRPRTNEYIYDGISALQPEPGQVVFYPIIDAIDEFKVNINSYSPEYGRSNGGAVIVNMRSGGNELHGTVF
ncbi:MAG: carboxypeptidase regulatory-like domain-containing protein, partial [Acidobacteriaceae bacterium]|nr:carboxypeptidase regulatory-like domain-containing protein [Acidobacteriaceae bacterium]